MNLSYPRIEKSSVGLNNRLCSRQCYFQGDYGGSLTVTVSAKPELSGLGIKVLLGSQIMTVELAAEQLQHWLSPVLQETAFESLPASLQLELLNAQLEPLSAILNQQFGQRPVLSQIEPCQSAETNSDALMLTIKQNDNTLCAWVTQGQDLLVAALPEVSSQLNQHIALPFWLSLGHTRLPLSDFRALEQGDVVFFDHCHFAEQQAVFLLSGRALWRCRFEDQTVQILERESAMNDIHNQESITDYQQLPVELTFDVGHQSVTLEQLGQLQPGFIFELDQPVNQPVTLRANGKAIGECELVNINERLGVRVTQLYTDQQAQV